MKNKTRTTAAVVAAAVGLTVVPIPQENHR